MGKRASTRGKKPEEAEVPAPPSGEPRAPGEGRARAPGEADAQVPDPGEAGPAEVPSPEELRDRVQQLEGELGELRDRLLRKQADLVNYRRRVERERAEYFEVARAEVIRQLLPVLDDFERAVAAEGRDLDRYREGVALILRRLREILAKMGVERLDPKGEAFDPRHHEAVVREETADVPDGQIVEVFQPGYRLGDRLLRPALVAVAKHPSGAPDKGDVTGEPVH